MKQTVFIVIGCLMIAHLTAQKVPEGFQSISETIPSLVLDLRYASTSNFTGSVVEGYRPAKKVLTLPTLRALQKVQDSLHKRGLGLKLFDGYRPQRAVNYFVVWSEQLSDTLMKKVYYPTIPKNELFEQGYIARRSGHSRGSTVDLTLMYLTGDRKGEALDMGTPFDYFGPESATFFETLTKEQRRNRKLLYEVMTHFGFTNYAQEWWHYTLAEEPYPDTYFDF